MRRTQQPGHCYLLQIFAVILKALPRSEIITTSDLACINIVISSDVMTRTNVIILNRGTLGGKLLQVCKLYTK